MASEPKPETQINGWSRFIVGRYPKRTLSRIAVVIITSIVVFRVLTTPIQVVGISMFPTYKEGQLNLVNRVSYWFAQPQRFDVVAVDVRSLGTNAVLLKRVIALPKEKIEIKDGEVYVNGNMLDEPYVRARFPWKEAYQLSDNEYFVIGDNRAMSLENHTHGAVDRKFIMGKVLF